MAQRKTVADIEPTGVSDKPEIKQYKCDNCGGEMLSDGTPICSQCLLNDVEELYKKYNSLRDLVEESELDISSEAMELSGMKPRPKRMSAKGEFQYSPKRDVLELRNELAELVNEHSPTDHKSMYGGLKYTLRQFDRSLRDHPLTYHNE